jgi:DNA-binding response OmpR family regulator
MSISRKFDTSVATPIRVIFLEDDHVLRHSLTDFLNLNSLSVVDVASVASFRKAISEQEFDVALIDLGLPDGNGFDVARHLHGSRIGLIVITARSGRADRLQSYEEGADLFFTKPVDGSELVLAIRNLARRLRPSELPGKSTYSASGSWRLDLSGQRLTDPSGALIKLSGRETAFVESLVDAKGDIVSREQLAAALGYDDVDAESRRVDAILRRLRQKARDAGIELPIHAVHALGFRFSAKSSAV